MTGNKATRLFLQATAAAFALVTALPTIAIAGPPDPAVTFAIRGATLQQALVRYAATTGIQLLYSSALVARRQAPDLVGDFTADVALSRLLTGSGLAARRVNAHVYVVEPSSSAARATKAAEGSDAERPSGSAVASASSAQTGLPSTSFAPAAKAPDTGTGNDIVVTGTHIRGANPGAPPVIRITRTDMERNGYGTVAQALQALPSNFGGTATEQAAISGADQTGTNGVLATGVNLRGLGADATLVLVNGQRVAGSGVQGSFGDVSMLPTGALDHVEVLLDGASAIYGSDAVGGVVNVLLRRHFDGVETRARLGSVTEGGRRTAQIDQTMGHRWSTGGVMLSYEYDYQGRLANADRAFAATSDFRPFGGTDHRYIYSSPGNILGISPSGAIVATYAIPPNQNGTGLTRSSFLAGQANLQDIRAGGDLIPKQQRHSVYLSFDQQLSSVITFDADLRYSHRAFDDRVTDGIAVLTINSRNPHFVSPTGAASDLIGYSFANEVGPSRNHGIAEAFAPSMGLSATLGRGWEMRTYAAFAREREHVVTDQTINTTALSEAVGTTADDPSTPYNAAVDGYFNPYGTGSSNSATTLAYISNGFSASRTVTRLLTGHLDVDGSLFKLPAGAIKVAVGGDVYRESFASIGTSRSGGIGVRTTYDTSGSRVIKAGFAEMRVPLVAPANAMPLVRRLDLSLAVRVESYPVFGTTTDPKVGASWSPVDGLTFRGSYGTSFRAPNLRQLEDAQRYSVTTVANASRATVPILFLSGGNPDLKPQTARSWTAGFDLKPVIVPGLHLSATGFKTGYSNRIDRPANTGIANALTDPSLAPFVQRVSPGTSAADLAAVNALLASPTFAGSNPFPVASIEAIVDGRYVNTGRVVVSGIDFDAGYSWPAGRNRFDLDVSGTYLAEWSEKVTPASSAVDRLDQPNRPVDLRGRAAVGWSRGVANAQIAFNYVTSYHDLVGNRVGAWRTVDLSIGAKFPAHHGRLGGNSVSLAVTNLLDATPPFYDSASGAAYDSANADGVGRVVALQFAHNW